MMNLLRKVLAGCLALGVLGAAPPSSAAPPSGSRAGGPLPPAAAEIVTLVVDKDFVFPEMTALPGQSFEQTVPVPVTYLLRDGTQQKGTQAMTVSVRNEGGKPTMGMVNGQLVPMVAFQCIGTIDWGIPTQRWFTHKVEWGGYYTTAYYIGESKIKLTAINPWKVSAAPYDYIVSAGSPGNPLYVLQSAGYEMPNWPYYWVGRNNNEWRLTPSGTCTPRLYYS